ncbi:lipolytic protein [Amycolatopsis deserti]|uniref:Lipolytic protein n=1 Tax=Amycolatopsis deserti TaxID=185696 RepID=A0ABQ3IM55_9PSEU|nr:alpha/beta hydrolase [Amycolatopsis deserti]GHE84359.1 lipolytic protein [Amycolatopsis deserti]
MPERTLVTSTGLSYSVLGDGPPLLMIAGFGQSGAVWDAVLPRFTQRFRCYCFSNRGAGGRPEDVAGLTIETLAEDAASIIRAIGEPAAVLGWSMGGAIAQCLARRDPDLVQALVLLSSMARRSELQRNWTAARLALLASGARPEQIETLLLPWMFTPAVLSNAERGAAIVRGNAKGSVVDPAGLRAQATALDQFDATAWLPEIVKPALVVVGAEDVLTPVSAAVELANGLPSADLVVLPRGGHAVILESPNEVVPPIVRFLSGVWQRPGERQLLNN